MPLLDQAGPVASPVAARPAGALVEELGAVLQRRLNLALALVLDPGLPLVADEPARDKVVVVSVQDPLPPLFRLEAVEEVMALEDVGAVGAGAARHARGAAVHVVRGRDLKVAALNVGGAEPVPDADGPGRRPLALDPLAGADAAHLGVLKGGQDPGHQRRRPGHVVVSHDGDGRLDAGQGLADLQALVGNGRVHDADLGVVERPGQLVQRLALVVGGDKNQLGGLAGQDALKRRAQLLKHVMDGRDDDRDIFVGKRRLAGDRLRLVGPVADTVNKQPDVTMQPGDPEASAQPIQFVPMHHHKSSNDNLTRESKRRMPKTLPIARNRARLEAG